MAAGGRPPLAEHWQGCQLPWGASTPTIQEIIVSWAITATGELRTRVLADRGAAAAAAIGTAAAHLQQRLNGATITPAIRTPSKARSLAITRSCVDHRPGIPNESRTRLAVRQAGSLPRRMASYLLASALATSPVLIRPRTRPAHSTDLWTSAATSCLRPPR
jgi:hypothetical protein